MKKVKTIEIDTCMCEEELELLLYEAEALFNECNLSNYFYESGRNVNWRGISSHTIRKHTSFEDILQRLYRAYGDFDLKACFFPKTKRIRLIASHHDCPDGSRFLLKPISKKVVEKLQKKGEI